VKREHEESERPLRLGITPVGLSFTAIFVMIGVVMAGTWLVNLIMAFFRWLDF
jgi:hypothetical protein